MPEKTPEKTGDAYDKARDLAEAALGEYAKGDERKGDKLAEQAMKTDRHAVEELVEDLNEDAEVTGVADVDAPDLHAPDLHAKDNRHASK